VTPPPHTGVAQARLPAAVMDRTATRQLVYFSMFVAGTCLLLQRFGVPFGAKAIDLVGPLVLIGAWLQLWRGILVFSRIRLGFFVATLALAAVGLAYNFAVPAPFGIAPSLESTAQFFIMTSFATFAFTETVPEREFFRAINLCLGVVAIAGILQFMAQFAGLSLFSFRGFVPDRLLFEDGYNVIIPFGIGSTIKSNGFFLLEPSIFCQMMALGIAIEVLTARRALYLAGFAAGMLVSGAGTGWLVLLAFILSVTVSLGARGALLALLTGTIVLVLAGGVVLLAPDVAATLGDRLHEFSQPGTSGHLRFITPFWALSDVLARAPAALLSGLGGGVSERLILPYEFDVNTPVKITLEYGAPAMLCYLGTITLGPKSPVQRALVVPALVLLMFTGGYQEFPPILFLVLLIISVARLSVSEAAAR
jgi:hypothetical protein